MVICALGESLSKAFFKDRIESQQDDVDLNIATQVDVSSTKKRSRALDESGAAIWRSAFAGPYSSFRDTAEKENDGELSKVLELDEREMKIEGTGNGVSDTANRERELHYR